VEAAITLIVIANGEKMGVPQRARRSGPRNRRPECACCKGRAYRAKYGKRASAEPVPPDSATLRICAEGAKARAPSDRDPGTLAGKSGRADTSLNPAPGAPPGREPQRARMISLKRQNALMSDKNGGDFWMPSLNPVGQFGPPATNRAGQAPRRPPRRPAASDH